MSKIGPLGMYCMWGTTAYLRIHRSRNSMLLGVHSRCVAPNGRVYHAHSKASVFSSESGTRSRDTHIWSQECGRTACLYAMPGRCEGHTSFAIVSNPLEHTSTHPLRLVANGRLLVTWKAILCGQWRTTHHLERAFSMISSYLHVHFGDGMGGDTRCQLVSILSLSPHHTTSSFLDLLHALASHLALLAYELSLSLSFSHCLRVSPLNSMSLVFFSYILCWSVRYS